VIADPQTATLALVKGLKPGRQRPDDLAKQGRVGWHELLAADWRRRLHFTANFWLAKGGRGDRPDRNLSGVFRGRATFGGMFTKRPEDAIPFWLFYFNIGDIDAAAERVKFGGGQVLKGPVELPGGGWIARCRDPQGAAFALQGTRSQDGFGWSTEWAGFSSKGRLVT